MLNSSHRNGPWLAALLALGLGACADTPEPADAPDPPAASESATAPVAQISQALGSFSQLWNGVNGETPLYVAAAGWTAFKHISAGCEQIDAIDTATGRKTSLAPLPVCASVTAVGAQLSGPLFVGTSAQRIYAMNPLATAGTGGGGSYDWQEIVSTSGTSISKILVDDSNVYWQDSSGIYRAPRSGGTGTKIGFSNRTLLAADGSVLWVQRDDGGGQWSLRTIGTGNGLPELIRATNAMPFAPGFWVEDSYTWWVENGAADGHNRLRRFTKADGSLATMKISSGVTYSLPMRAGTVLYYIDKNISNGTVTMRSHNVTTGVQTSAVVGVLDVLHMALGSYVYFTAQTSSSPVRYGLQRGTL
jgi:hypothetical protein